MSVRMKIVLLRLIQMVTVAGAALICFGAVAVGMMGRSDGCGRIPFAMADLKAIATALRMYEADMGTYPVESSGLELLLLKPSAPGWKGPYLDSREIPQDPWGHAYRYRGLKDGADFDLVCLGPDGRAGTEDDIKELRRSP